MQGTLLGVALATGIAPAPEPAVSWTAPAPPVCPETETIRARIETLLGRPLGEGEVQVRAEVTTSEAGFDLWLRVGSGEVVDERRLSAEDCPALAETTALVAAVLVDPEVAERMLGPSVPEPEEPPPPEPEPPPEERPPQETPPQEPPPQGPPAEALPPVEPAPPPEPALAPAGPGVWVRARGGGEFGAIPGGTGGVSLALAAGGARFRGELAGTYWVRREATSANASARIHLGYASARACGRVPAGPVAAMLCAGLELGAMRGDASTPAPLSRNRLWLAGQAEVAVHWQATRRISLWLGAQPFVPIVFPRFELSDPAAPDQPETIYAPSAAGIRGLAGVEVRLFGADPGPPR